MILYIVEVPSKSSQSLITKIAHRDFTSHHFHPNFYTYLLADSWVISEKQSSLELLAQVWSQWFLALALSNKPNGCKKSKTYLGSQLTMKPRTPNCSPKFFEFKVSFSFILYGSKRWNESTKIAKIRAQKNSDQSAQNVFIYYARRDQIEVQML